MAGAEIFDFGGLSEDGNTLEMLCQISFVISSLLSYRVPHGRPTACCYSLLVAPEPVLVILSNIVRCKRTDIRSAKSSGSFSNVSVAAAVS